ncbi:MAG: hypothetical protein ABI723_26615 [Bacteroidia bacterium]
MITKNPDCCFDLYKPFLFPHRFLISIIIFLISNTIVAAQPASSFEKAGDKAFAKGDYFNAAYFFDQALDVKGKDVDLSFKKAESQRLYNDYKNAALSYSRVVADDDGHKYPLAVFYLAEMKKCLGLYETAKGFYKMYDLQAKITKDYFALKTDLEIRACDTALKLLAAPIKATVTNMGSNVNSVYSDFAGLMLNSKELYFSSNKFEETVPGEKGKKTFVSKILTSEKKNNRYVLAKPIDEVINTENENNSNATISADKKLMVFCRCKSDSINKLKCKMYESKFADKEWTIPQLISAHQINLDQYTYTQPSLSTNGNEGYLLFFVSDMAGGFGKADIWKSNVTIDGTINEPVNVGNTINTFADDVTPFYSKGEEALYFSSEGHEGLGGFDIFRSKNNGNSFSYPVNIGPPLNSSTNDLYFTVNDNDTTGVLTSNRTGSLFIKAATCCYDLYYYIMPKEEKKKMTGEIQKSSSVISLDDVPMSTRDTATRSMIEQELEFTFPLSLYFDNDQPDPGTIKETTKSSYDALHVEYLKNLDKYKKNYAASFGKNERDTASKKITDFFNVDLNAGYQRLDKMCNYILKLLERGKTVQLTVKGSTSPLADSEYNYHLSQRRISCFLNYINAYESGVLKTYIQNKKLEITEEAQGETAFKNVSDQAQNKAQSIYSPEAARARRIEVTSLSVK